MSDDNKIEKNKEILRMVLPMIAQCKLAATPPNYAAWYEYFSASSPELKEALDTALSNGGVDQHLMDQLYEQYVANADLNRLQAVQLGIGTILTEVSSTVSAVDDQVSEFDKSLGKQASRLKTVDSGDSGGGIGIINEVIEGMLQDSMRLHSANTDLQKALLDKQNMVAELKEELENAKHYATIDPLTGLVNRVKLEAEFASVVAAYAEDEQPCWMLMLDIDHFKSVNDNFGHVFGDKVIKLVAAVIKMGIKGADTACRYGGEEFAVLLPNTPLDGVMVVAESIRKTIEKGKVKQGSQGEVVAHVTISIGAAKYQQDDTLQSLLDRADQALYQSKENGRNRVTLSDS